MVFYSAHYMCLTVSLRKQKMAMVLYQPKRGKIINLTGQKCTFNVQGHIYGSNKIIS